MSSTLQPGYVLAPEAIEAVSRPVVEAVTLPPECYTDPAFYERECERIFAREWICVGRVEDVAEIGDYLTTTIVNEPLIVVRDGTGTIRAHFNVCRHRRCAIVEGSGSTKTFRCPYHGWMYALDGTLRGTPAFKETLDFDKADYPLMSARVEIWNGWIFVNLDDDAPAVAALMSETSKWGCERYGMDRMTTVSRWEYRIPCNWKVYTDNFIESYHVPWVHPETFGLLTPLKRWVDFPDMTAQPWAVQVGQTPGLTFSDTGDALFPVTPELEGLPVDLDGMPVWLVFPTLMVLPTVDALIYYVVFPEGPEQSRIMVRVCVPDESARAYAAGGDPDVTRAVEEYTRNVKAFLDEDNHICEQQQIGLRSRRGEPGRFCKHESLTRIFDQWVADRAYGPELD